MKLVIMACEPLSQMKLMTYDTESHEVDINYDTVKEKLGIQGFLEALSRMLLWTMDKVRNDAKVKAEETINEHAQQTGKH